MTNPQRIQPDDFEAPWGELARNFDLESFEQDHRLGDDGFEELWNVTDSSEAVVSPQSTLEGLIDSQKEEILCLKEEMEILQEDNHKLRQDLAELISRSKFYESLAKDYASLLELNRCLTRQLNHVMNLHEKTSSQIKAVKSLLF